MEEKKIVLTAKVMPTDELSCGDRRLRAAAIDAAGRAYAPYSRFSVGAAALLADDSIVTGNNQENMAYPSGLCAERVALFAAGATFPDIPVTAIAIVAMSGGEVHPHVSPCGSCRQVMLETERRYGGAIRVLMCGRDETVVVSSVSGLMPFAFGL
ncbi:MAG: cytidine deaminase [Tannerella sp.]|jgi:cytidine deaminase|nr:cytidine deaminase [Tannerella sp.]